MRYRKLVAVLLLSFVPGAVLAEPATVPEPPAAVTKPLPESVEDLKAFQNHTRAIVEKVIPATVCLRVGGASGSGVIVSEDGLILTAGHVSGEPGRAIKIVLHDGTIVDGETLGMGPRIDSGMAKITTKGKWSYVAMGISKEIKPGDWVVSTGHPGGYRKERPPVVRVGRIGIRNDSMVQSDCTLVGGDSGGPLFDMRGRVVGIHSRIGTPITANIHVPVDTYRETWDDLVKGDVVGADPYLGVTMDETVKECKLGSVTRGAPAERGGVRAGDVIVKFNGKDVSTYDEMVNTLKTHRPMQEVVLLVKRGDEYRELKVKLGYR